MASTWRSTPRRLSSSAGSAELVALEAGAGVVAQHAVVALGHRQRAGDGRVARLHERRQPAAVAPVVAPLVDRQQAQPVGVAVQHAVALAHQTRSGCC
jgi:hypothetical protein